MTFKAPDSLAEQIAHHLAERIIRGELKERERIQEQKVTQALNVSRGSVREALLILERRHLIVILPRRGAQVTELTAHNVKSLYALVMELYIVLGNAVAVSWRNEADLAPLLAVQRQLQASAAREDIDAFVENSFDVMRAAFPFANNPYLQETLENLLPAISRTYHLALARRKSEMSQFLNTFASLLQAVLARNAEQVRSVLLAYGQRNCTLVLAAMAER
ncbi:MAG: GntR family transcriptional regulator [Pseudomonas sp.]|uniref:GntR family transcriptional regulator n=1 Tax=Pseudomonas sp. TaxID=306 RepID=UPI00273539A9|nr:GntR family transcriptional regulator [Pseudomonas sp.]MDP3844812.1 GntR family transcriptional regulator [Pseudomonas sp.]